MKIALNGLKIFLMIFVLTALLWTGGLALFFMKASSWKPADIDRATNAIVILTGGGGRLKAGLNLFAAQRAPFLFVTGIYDALNEADVRARWTGQTPLPECCIIIDYNAQTTAQNALMTRKWIGYHDSGEIDYNAPYMDVFAPIRSVRLVTSNYHMPRAMIDFQRILPDIEIIPHPIKPPSTHSTDKLYWRILLKEYNKYILRVVQGWLPQSLQGIFA